jgi:hypothetical protein
MKRIALVTALLAASCAEPADPVPGAAIIVELDAFSGRPNPRWQLSDTEAVELRRRLSDLPVAAGATLPDAGLGYRGFVVEMGDDRRYITGGLVAAGEPPVIRRDARGAENYLKETSRRRGYSDTIYFK